MSRTEHILTLAEVIAAVSSAALRARGTAALKALVESSLDVAPEPGIVERPASASKAALRAKRYREANAKRDGERDASRSSVTKGVTDRDEKRDASRDERDGERDEKRDASRSVTPPSRSLSLFSPDSETEKIPENTGDKRESPDPTGAREGRDERDEKRDASRSVTVAVTPLRTPLGSPRADAVAAEVERQIESSSMTPEGRVFLAGIDRVRFAREMALLADKSPVDLAVRVTEELCKAAAVSLPSAAPWSHEDFYAKARGYVASAEAKARREASRRPGDARAMGRQDQLDPATTPWLQEPREAT